MWSDEDDLSLIIQSLVVDDGTITVKWLDGIEDTIAMDYYTPKGKTRRVE